MKPVCAAAVLLGTAVSMLSPPARADGGFDVRPTLIETRTGLASVTIDNPNDHRIYLSTAIYDWSKDASGADTLVESQAAMASPPAMWVSPHSSYTLRVQLPPAADGIERAFRVLIKQVPARSDMAAGRIVFAVTQSLPAFSKPEELRPMALSGRLVGGNLVLSNSGGTHARLVGVHQDGRTLGSGLIGYVLPQSVLTLHLEAAIHPGRVELDTDQGTRTVDIR